MHPNLWLNGSKGNLTRILSGHMAPWPHVAFNCHAEVARLSGGQPTRPLHILRRGAGGPPPTPALVSCLRRGASQVKNGSGPGPLAPFIAAGPGGQMPARPGCWPAGRLKPCNDIWRPAG